MDFAKKLLRAAGIDGGIAARAVSISGDGVEEIEQCLELAGRGEVLRPEKPAPKMSVGGKGPVFVY